MRPTLRLLVKPTLYFYTQFKPDICLQEHMAPAAALAAALHAGRAPRRRAPRLPLRQAVRAHQEQPVQEDEERVAEQRVSGQVSARVYIET